MGRTVKRVPLDFEWAQDEIWEGYINPIRPTPCTQCKGTGHSPQVQDLYARWYGWDQAAQWVWCDTTHTRRWNKNAWNQNLDEKDVQALLDEDRLWDFTRVPLSDAHRQIVAQRKQDGHNCWLPFNNGYIPTPQEVNEWNTQGLGHDSINASIVITAKAKRCGYPLVCFVCQGEGHLWASCEEKHLYDAWEPSEPPAGEGYQLWETTTEGSPVSPVFATLDALCEWCEKNATTFGSYTASVAQWKEMLSEDFVYHAEGPCVFL